MTALRCCLSPRLAELASMACLFLALRQAGGGSKPPRLTRIAKIAAGSVYQWGAPDRGRPDPSTPFPFLVTADLVGRWT
jgi:hypothetical protein